MKKTQTTVKFQQTPEQEKQLLEMIESYKGQKSPLMPVLQEAQKIYGYLPIEVQKIIADKMDVPLEEIYGIVTFYSQFLLNPKGEIAISVCLGTACYVKGSGDVLNRIVEKLGVAPGTTSDDGKYSLEETRCVGARGLAPVVIINDDVYGRLAPADMDAILEKYM